MASIKVRSETTSSITWEIYNLSSPAQDYEEFRVDVSGEPSIYWTSNNTGTNTYKTMYGLNSSTSYTGYGYAKWNGTWYSTGSATGTTDTPPDTTDPSISIYSPSNYSYHSGSVTIYASASDSGSGVNYVNFYNSILGEKTDYSSTYTATYSIGSLSDGQYTFTAKAYDNAGNSSSNDYLYINVDNTPPSCWNVQGEPTGTTINVTWSASDSGSGLSHFRVYRGTSYNTVSDASARSYEITGLTEDTKYTIYVRAYDNAGNYVDSTSKEITTLSGRPLDWKWTTAQDTNGHKIQGADYRMGNTEWNNFTDRINEFRAYKGFSTITFTQEGYGNTFYASRFNAAKDAIGGMNATGISDRVKNDDVTAQLLNTLMDKLNEL